MPAAALNLIAIDEAFGERADLYRDVLRIKSDVSSDEVQQAYFDRRDELFQILGKMDQSGVPTDSPRRYQVERQMDAVVMCLRVLGDPDSRMMYDAIRRDRVVGRRISAAYSQSLASSTMEEDIPLGTATSISYSDRSNKSNHSRRRLKSALKKTRGVDDPYERSTTINRNQSVEFYEYPTSEGRVDYDIPPRPLHSKDEASRSSRHSRKSASGGSKSSHRSSGGSTKGAKNGATRVSTKRKTRKVTPPRDETRETKSHKIVADDDVSVGSQGTTLTTLESQRSMFEVVKEEIKGVFEDTSKSVEQVFSAFTLQDDEIAAVFGRIDKAKMQMVNEFKG